MRVAYVFMKFPGRQETFAGTEMRALLKHGIHVSVYPLRSRPVGANEILSHWGLQDLSVQWVSPAGYVFGLLMLFRHPVWSFHLLTSVLRDNAHNPIHVVKSVFLVPFVLCSFSRILKDEPDVVHLFWGHYPSMLGIMSRRFGSKSALSMFLGAYDLNTEYVTSRRCARAADAVFTHARANVDRLRSFGLKPEKIHLVYRGTDLSLFRNLEGAKVRGRIISVAYLEEEKGMRHVLEVFRRVKERLPDASLVIVGDGPDRKFLERKKSELRLDDIRFTGHIPHKEVIQELDAAEVFLFLSYSEDDRLPNAVKEAIAARCICVVSNTRGIGELIEHDHSGFVVPYDDHATAAERVIAALDGGGNVKEISDNALQALQSTFDVMKTSKQYIDTWESISDVRADVSTRVPSHSGH